MSIIVQHRRDARTICEANTPANGELWWDQTLKAWRGGDGVTLGGFLHKRWGYSYPVSPAQITANQNDYNPTDLAVAETLLLNSDAARTITGIAGGAFGRNIKLINRGGFDITLANASASSTAANRFLFESDVVLRPNGAIELQWSTTDSRWMRISGGTKLATIPQELLLTGVISPAQITANTNDYAPANVTVATALRLSTDTTRNLTGLVDPREGVIKTIINVGTNPLLLKNADVGSTAANRFDFGSDVTLAGKQSATIRYDGTDARWKLLSSTAGAAVAAGAVTAQTLSSSAVSVRAGMVNGTIAESRVGGAVTYSIKTLAGIDPSAADPVYAVFNNGSGGYVVRSIISALALTISSGSSLGAINSTPFRVWLLLLDNSGSVEFAAVICSDASGVMPLDEGLPISTTAEGGGGSADTIKTIYSSASRASKFFCFAGQASYDAGLAAAGTWNVAPSTLSVFGGASRRPGDVIQMKTVGNTSPTSVNNTSYQNTALQLAITLASPQNLIEATGACGIRSDAALVGVYCRLHRGSVAVGNESVGLGGASVQSFPAVLQAFDAPGSVGPHTYMAKIKNDASASVSLTGNASVLTLKEVVG